MTIAHMLYIPLMIMVGIFIGYHFGRHAAEEELRRRRRIRDQRATEN